MIFLVSVSIFSFTLTQYLLIFQMVELLQVFSFLRFIDIDVPVILKGFLNVFSIASFPKLSQTFKLKEVSSYLLFENTLPYTQCPKRMSQLENCSIFYNHSTILILAAGYASLYFITYGLVHLMHKVTFN